jgi:branched-chain amino acid transport system permease protein
MIDVLLVAVILGSVYSLFAAGLSLVWGVLKVLNLAYGALFTLSAYVAYFVAVKTDLPLWAIIVIGMATGAIANVLIELLIFRRLRNRSRSVAELELAQMVASIGIAAVPVTIIQQLTLNSTQSMPPRLSTFETFKPAEWLSFTSIQVITVALAVGISLILAIGVRRTRYGRALRALAVDRETAGLMGVNAGGAFLGTMALSGALAGLAGVLLSLYLSSVSPTLGDSLMLKAFAVIIVGGIGSISGAMIGGFGLALVEAFTVTYGNSAYQSAVAFVVIIVFLLVRPNGIFPQARGTRS